MTTMTNTQARSTTFGTFENYYQNMVADYQRNPSRLSYQVFCDMTNRAKRPLSCANQAQFYSAAYAMQHYQSFMTLLSNKIKVDEAPLFLNIVDYGCGQGIATLAVLDFIAQHFTGCMDRPVINVHLIEPSPVTLPIAKDLVTRRVHELEFDLVLTSQNTELKYTRLPNAMKQNGYQTLHLFANVLDIVGVWLSLEPVVREMNDICGQSFVFASSPNYKGADKGFCQLSALWAHNANPVIETSNVEHYSYRVIQNRWLTSQAKSIQMVLALDEVYHQAA